MNSCVKSVFLVPGHPHLLLAADQNEGWQRLNQAYGEARKRIEELNPDLILYFSTQWFSVIGHLFQANPKPKWVHVDQEWHELGSIPYEFVIDPDFAKSYADLTRQQGYHAATVNYYGFPIDTGSIVAQKLLNPHNKFPASMVSCNIYADRDEMLRLGHAACSALAEQGKSAVIVLVSALSNRLWVKDIDPAQDAISSAKDHEWNLKICELLGEGRLEDVAQCAREFAREANADMGFKGIWWLNGLLGHHNDFSGKCYGYEAVWGTGAGLLEITPKVPILPGFSLNFESESSVIQAMEAADPAFRGQKSGPEEDAPTGNSPTENKVSRSVSAPVATVQAQKIESQKAPEPVGAYPHARREGDFLFLSGVGPRQRGSAAIPGVTLNEHGEVIDWDIRVQTRAVIENVRTILEDAGSSLDKVVDVTVFLTDMKRDFKAYNEVYAELLGPIGPTRTTLGISSLPTPIAIELKVVAKP
ncbi:MAG: hypothetical protein H6510_16970 [Acidobacteria bacterium]|nr:hypothetical protein [Acidobacteriota bacterium]MCB9399506.1 hypothetical protein [Acidobacteriota bacterium]